MRPGKVLSGFFLYRILQPALESEQGRVLKKHHGESTHQAVMQTIIDLSLLSAVFDLPESLCHFLSHGGEAEMFFLMHPPSFQ
jgi:hypothetical protein